MTVACDVTEPEDGPTLDVTGRVTVNDTAPQVGRVQIIYLHPRLASPYASAGNGPDGRYELSIDMSNGVDAEGCYGSLVALMVDPSLSLPIQSEEERVAPFPVPDVCEGPITGPDFALDHPPNVVPVDVSGMVTLGGTPTSATVRLVIDVRRIWGSQVVAETVTDADGNYRIVTEVPDFFCDDMRFATVPAGAATTSVSGCHRTTQDIELGG